MKSLEITKNGQVYNNGKLLKQYVNSSGYLRVQVKGKHYFVHRLVAEKHIESECGCPQVDHINGNKTDNRSVNLRWVNQGKNIRNNHFRAPNLGKVKIKCVDTGIVYDSITRAAEAYKVHRRSIYNNLYGFTKSSGGVKWQLNIEE